MGLSDKVKDEVKNKAKQIVIKYILPYVVGFLFIFILIAGAFFVIEEKIKDAADAVVKAATKSTFKTSFDNTSDTPQLVVSDDMIKEIKEGLKEEGIDIDETYLTDGLLKKSIEAYYAMQYPYIDGIKYNDDMVKGCIYLKRGTEQMTYKNYNDFQEMLGSGKSKSDVDNAKKYFSVDDEQNIVVVTWNRSSKVTETADGEGGTIKEGEEVNTYEVSEYKIDQNSITKQYTMSYKLPILLGNMYSNEGFGIAVAELAINSKVELSILDDTTYTQTITKEYYKMNYKVNSKLKYKKNIVSSSYQWWDTTGNQTPLVQNITSTEQEADCDEATWVEDYTQDPYQTVTEENEDNNITIKVTDLDTWTTKGTVTDVTSSTTNNTEPTQTTEPENKPKDDKKSQENTFTTIESVYKEEIKEKVNSKITELDTATQTEVINGFTTKYIELNDEETYKTLYDSAVLNYQNYSPKIEVIEINTTEYKKMTDHKMTTDVKTKTTSYTSSDMELKDNTDRFLALIKANSNGQYDKNGDLVQYTVKGVELSKTDTTSILQETNTGNAKSYIVKTDKENALPKLTKDQLKKACNCLSGEQKTNALKFIDAVKKAEDKYKVNAVFSLAVFRTENGIATDKSGILGHNTYNIGSLKGTYNGNSYGEYKSYPNYDEAIVDYAKNIAEGKYYFKAGKYDLKSIGITYCGTNWVKTTKGYIDEFYKAAGVDITANVGEDNSIDTDIDSADVKTIMKWSDKQAWKAITGTAYSSKPTSSQVSENTMESRMKTITVKIRTGKNSSKNQNMTVNKAIAPLWEEFFKDLYDNCQDFYIVSYDGAYKYRANTSGSSMSAHAFGCAIDINADISGNRYQQKPYSEAEWSKLTDKKVKHSTIYFNSPMLKVAHKYTIINGSDWSNPNDAMHFSFIGDWSRSQAKSKLGK